MTLVQTACSRKGVIFVVDLVHLQFRLRFFRVIGQFLFAFLWERFSRSFGTGGSSSADPPLKGWAILKSPFGRGQTDPLAGLRNRGLKNDENVTLV